ncbi:MAG TPA: hypothetical protein PLF81_26595, partial [Candidatus Anammoximicrobium sp.]|nr:hypothetical protein [Candidatus Anammoximicrobium sp.]
MKATLLLPLLILAGAPGYGQTIGHWTFDGSGSSSVQGPAVGVPRRWSERPTRWPAGHYSSSTRLTADAPRWRHVAVVYDQPVGVVTCWVDYHLTQSAKVSKPLAWDDGPFLIGGRGDRWGVAGLLDEVRVVRGADLARPQDDRRAGRPLHHRR